MSNKIGKFLYLMLICEFSPIIHYSNANIAINWQHQYYVIYTKDVFDIKFEIKKFKNQTLFLC